MLDVGAAFLYFPSEHPEQALRLFHAAMLIRAEKGEILSFQEFYGNILYYEPREFPIEFEPMTFDQLRQAQDELRRRYNFERN